HAVAAQGAEPGRVHAAGAAADDDDVFPDLGRLQLGLAAYAGVHGAGDGAALQHVRHAAQQAGYAGGELLKLAVPRLVRQLGVGYALAAEGDEVRAALLHQQLRVLRLREAAHKDDGDGHGPFYLGAELGVEAAVGDVRGPHELVVDVDGAGDVDGVHAADLFEIGRDGRRVVDVHAAVALVAGVDAAEDGHVAAGLLADVLDYEPGQAHAVLKAAAELVRALVGARGDEGAHEVAV